MQISSAPYANICRYVCIYMYAYMHTQKNHTYTSWVDTESCNGRKRLILIIITKKSYFFCRSWVDTESCNGHDSSHQSAHLAGHLNKIYINRGPSVHMYYLLARVGNALFVGDTEVTGRQALRMGRGGKKGEKTSLAVSEIRCSWAAQ